MKKTIIIILTVLCSNFINAQCFNQISEADDFEIVTSNEITFDDIPLVESICNLYGMFPIIKKYNSNNKPNAVAFRSNTTELINRYGKNKYGYILISEKLITDTRKMNNGILMGVCSILSHELAHIHFFNVIDSNGDLSQEFSIKEMELYADFFSGYIMNIFQRGFYNKKTREHGNKEDRKVWLDWFSEFIFKSGDTAFSNPQHHGTKSERLMAFANGHKQAEKSTEFYKALQAALDFLIDLKIERTGDQTISRIIVKPSK